MNGRRATIGLALLCTLAFCAFAAPSALAAGTTAFTCAEGGGEKDFADAHCDTSAKVGEGKFGHVSIAAGTKTEITITNEKTAEETKAAQPFVLSGILGGVSVTIECKVVSGTGVLTNEENGKGTMQAAGTALIQTTGCTTNQPNCKVKEPISWDTNFTTYQNESAMGVEFTPRVPPHFGSWTLTDNGEKKCAIKNTFTIDGNFQGTPGGTALGKGATLKVTEATSKNLQWGGNPYVLTGAMTWRMKEGNPITWTTTTK